MAPPCCPPPGGFARSCPLCYPHARLFSRFCRAGGWLRAKSVPTQLCWCFCEVHALCPPPPPQQPWSPVPSHLPHPPPPFCLQGSVPELTHRHISQGGGSVSLQFLLCLGTPISVMLGSDQALCWYFPFPGSKSQPSPWAASDAETPRFSPSDWVRRGPGLAINSWEWRFSRNKFLPLWARGTDLVNLGFTALEPVFRRVSVYPSRLTWPCEADLYRL